MPEEDLEMEIERLLTSRRTIGVAIILIMTAIVVAKWGLIVFFGMLTFSCIFIWVVFRLILGEKVKITFKKVEKEE